MEEKYIIRVYGTLYLDFIAMRNNTFRLNRDIKQAKVFDTLKDALITKDAMDALAKAKGENPIPKVEIIKIN